MSWRNRIALIGLPLLLAGCGFQPLYAKKTQDSTSKLMAGVSVKIDSITGHTDPNTGHTDSNTGRMNQELKQELEDRLNPGSLVPKSPVYHLDIKVSETVTSIGVSRDGTVSRYNVYLNTQYALYRNADNKQIASGNINYVDSYNNLTNAYFSTYISSEDALKRGITELSELYRQRLAGYLEKGAQPEPNQQDKDGHNIGIPQHKESPFGTYNMTPPP